jgi:hypothetical protein
MRPIVFRDGFSESAWKSLAVKSLRIGWPEGLSQAIARLGQRTGSGLLTCGIFEDTFPAIQELAATFAEVWNLDFGALCARQTHHGRGYSDAFCDLENESVRAAIGEREALCEAARELNVSLPSRGLNCFYTWRALRPGDAGETRTLDGALWRGMPTVMLDGHTAEGARAGRRVTLLSGSYQQHRVIGQRVMSEGWDRIRTESHEEITEPFLRRKD